MRRSSAEILREYGPFDGVGVVHGVTYDGKRVWFASGDRLHALDPESGEIVGGLEIPADAGTAFDGRNLYQIAEGRIHKIDPGTGEVLSTIPAPGGGDGDSGLAWAEGALWVGQFGGRRIHQVDPESGEIMRTLEANRRVTGVTWVDGELWHGAADGDRNALRRLDGATGEALEEVELPAGVVVTGLESDGAEHFYCGGSTSGTVRLVRRPPRA